MLPIRSPLGAVGAILVALEAIATASLFALESDPSLRTWMVAAMIFVFILVTVVILGVIVYFALRRPAYLFNPSDISDSAHFSLYGGGIDRTATITISAEPESVIVPPSLLGESDENNEINL